jgi:hypothetical protein
MKTLSTPARLVSRTALALALAAGGLAAQAQGAAPASAAASAPADTARADVAKPLQAAQALVQQKQYAEAQAKLKEAEAVGNLTPYETYHVERTRAVIANGLNDVPLTIKALEASLATGKAAPDEKMRNLLVLADLNFRQKDYPAAVSAANRYFEAGGQDPVARQITTNALYLQNDWAGAAKALSAEIQADEAAGRQPTEQRLRMLASAQSKLNDDEGYARTVERLATRFPKPELWADLINRAQSQPGFSDALRLDAYRLRMATGTLTRANEYVEAAQLALQAGYPAEAQKIVEEGYAKNLLGTGPNAASHGQLRAQAKRLAASDAAALQGATAAGARSSDVLATMGWALATSGQADKGIPMIEQAIAKGGLKRPDDTKLRLGVAQYQAGRKDAAAQTFKSVQGKDGSAALAHLWGLLAQAPAPAAQAQQ